MLASSAAFLRSERRAERFLVGEAEGSLKKGGGRSAISSLKVGMLRSFELWDLSLGSAAGSVSSF